MGLFFRPTTKLHNQHSRLPLAVTLVFVADLQVIQTAGHVLQTEGHWMIASSGEECCFFLDRQFVFVRLHYRAPHSCRRVPESCGCTRNRGIRHWLANEHLKMWPGSPSPPRPALAQCGRKHTLLETFNDHCGKPAAMFVDNVPTRYAYPNNGMLFIIIISLAIRKCAA